MVFFLLLQPSLSNVNKLKNLTKIKLFFLIVLLSGLCTTSSSRPVDTGSRPRSRSGVDIRVTELLIKAMRARDAGDMNSAELFWIQAQASRPSLRRPAWLDLTPMPVVEQPALSQDELVARIRLMPYSSAKVILGERLARNPGNTAFRQVFMELAEKNADYTEASRHRSILEGDPVSVGDILIYGLAFIIGILLLWQIVKLVQDLRRR